jgi:hypothetical protein
MTRILALTADDGSQADEPSWTGPPGHRDGTGVVFGGQGPASTPGIDGEAGLFVELADGGPWDWFAGFAPADGQVPHVLGELGVGVAL